MGFKEKVKKILLGKRYDSHTYIEYLRRLGIKIGDDCTIYVPSKTLIDEQYPWMITIGNHVRITEGVKILTHDYAWSVLKSDIGAICGASGTVRIGNNVFIGMNTIITRNIEIGDNVIIGAGSVVTSNCDSNSVYAGVPAKRIMSIDDYCEKRAKVQFAEARKLAIEFYNRYGKRPEKEVFHEYFMLFETAENAMQNNTFRKKIQLGENESSTIAYMDMHKPMFSCYDEFIKTCFENNDDIIQRNKSNES